LGQYFDVVDHADAIDEILRRALCEAWPTHQYPDFFAEVAQEDRCLAGRIAATDQNDFFVPAQARLDRGSPVPDTAPSKSARFGMLSRR
jgi:hypothetical protein